jgi:hypothetical protein
VDGHVAKRGGATSLCENRERLSGDGCPGRGRQQCNPLEDFLHPGHVFREDLMAAVLNATAGDGTPSLPGPTE